jgi:ribosomal protein S18 acetylase RimI-like enzyme
MKPIHLNDIVIRTTLQSGDLGYVIYLHGLLYNKEYNYGIVFESYVAQGLHEFYEQYDPNTSRVWVCEHQQKMIGFMLLMNRGTEAQLRYFIILPEYRGIGLGKKLMTLFMDFLKQCNYKKSYLWTTALHSSTSLQNTRFYSRPGKRINCFWKAPERK